MLIIRRRIGERIVIGTHIAITVAAATKRSVRLAIEAPDGVSVLRGEVHEAVVAANMAASAVDDDINIGEDTEDDNVTEDPPELVIEPALAAGE